MAGAAGRPDAAQIHAVHAGFVRHGRRGRPARGSAEGEDKDSLTVGSRTAVRRLDRRGEDKDPPTFLIYPRSTTPPRRVRRPRRLADPAHPGGSGGSGGRAHAAR